MCTFHGWVHKAHIPPACLLVFVWLYVFEHICSRGGDVGEEWGWCYNNKPGSSVTLNSPIFQEESKQNWLLLHICTYYKYMGVS